MQLPGTNLQWFRVRTDTLTLVERKPPAITSTPFTTPEPVFDADEVLERIRAVEQENLKRLEDDIAILTKYFKTQNAPKAVIDTIEGLSGEQQESWDNAIDRIKKLLEE